MKIVLTGASSFTGLWLAKALVEGGHDVVAPLRADASALGSALRRARIGELTRMGVRIIEGAPFGSDAFLDVLAQGCDLLCHHGAEVTNYKSLDFDIEGAVRSNTLKARHVFERGLAHGLRGVVVTGSVFEHDEGAGEHPLKAFSPYGLSKGLSWQVFRYWGQHLDLPVHKFVIPNPFGPFEEPRFCAYLLQTWLKGETASVATPWYVRDNIHVSLLAAMYRRFVDEAAVTRTPQRCAPSGYVEQQGVFARRFAREIGSRLGIETPLRLVEQHPFVEPRTRINTDAPPGDLVWSEATAWDGLSDYYRATYKPA